MSVTVQLGPKSLMSLGVALADVALLFDCGRKFGNFLRATKNEEDLLDSIMEDATAILRRKGLVETARMESRWSHIQFMYQGQRIDNANQPTVASKQDLSALSWLMVVVIAALDTCLPQAEVQALLVDVFKSVLGGDQDMEDSLRVQMPTNIQSWRDVARVRGIADRTAAWLAKDRRRLVDVASVPQLNPAEFREAHDLLVWLLDGQTHAFECISATIFAVAQSMQRAGILLNTRGPRQYETQPVVMYVDTQTPLDCGTAKHHPSEYVDPLKLSKGIGSLAQVISYPLRDPQSMIETIPASRGVKNAMHACWKLGKDAASRMQLSAYTHLPFESSSEVYYRIDHSDPETSRYGPELSLIASHAFPRVTEGILRGLEYVVEGIDRHCIEWISTHTELEFLLQRQSALPSDRREYMEIWLKYQALVFGFYYKLLDPLVSHQHMSEEAFVKGTWGYGSTTFLAACSQIGQSLRRDDRVSRSHLLHIISMMYAGRTKLYSASSSPAGLVGIIHAVSVLTKPLLQTTDKPEDIGRFVIVGLPIIDLAADINGELYSAYSCDVHFKAPPEDAKKIVPRSPKGSWSINAKMGSLFRQNPGGVVMAARCNGRLVGWFSPLAADIVFLSAAYQSHRHKDDPDYSDDPSVTGFEMTDEIWEAGHAIRPLPHNCIGVVHSKGCPALRYAAAAIFAAVGEEVSIATDDFAAARGRVEGQDGGIVVA